MLKRLLNILLLRIRRRSAEWRALAFFTSVMIVFVTTYSLIVPAITLSTDSAEEMAGVYLEEEAMADEEYESNDDGAYYEEPDEEIIAADDTAEETPDPDETGEEPKIIEPAATEEITSEDAFISTASEMSESSAENVSVTEEFLAPEELIEDGRYIIVRYGDDGNSYAMNKDGMAVPVVYDPVQNTAYCEDENQDIVWTKEGYVLRSDDDTYINLDEATEGTPAVSDEEAWLSAEKPDEGQFTAALYRTVVTDDVPKYYALVLPQDGTFFTTTIIDTRPVKRTILAKEAEREDDTEEEALSIAETVAEEETLLIAETVAEEGTLSDAESAAEPVAEETAAMSAIESVAESMTESVAEPVLIEYEAGSVTVPVEGADYTIQVSWGAEACIPGDAIFKAISLDQQEEYAEYAEKAVEAAEAEQQETDKEKSSSAIGVFDLTIYDAAGQVVQPAVPVSVSVNFGETLAAETEVCAVHFAGTGVQEEPEDDGIEYDEIESVTDTPDPAVIEAVNEDGAVSFEADSFSVYVIVGTETFTVDYLTADGETYTITVHFGPEAGIPSNAKLEVNEVLSEADGYTRSVDEAIVNLQEDAYVSSAKLFDIKITVDGEEFEPKAPVDVTIEYKEPEDLTAVMDVSVLHFGKDETEILDAEVQGSEGQMDGVTFTTESFSLYAVVVLDKTEGSFEYAGQGYKVKISYTAAAQFPEGTQMTIREIGADTDEYNRLLGEAWTKLNADYLLYKAKMKELRGTLGEADTTLVPEPVPLKNIDGVRFFDITFTYDGEEVEPCTPVQVQIDLDDGMQLFEHYGTEVVHFGSAGTEIMNGVNARLDDDDSLVGVAYSQSSFSPIGIMSVRDAEDDPARENDTENRSSVVQLLTSFKAIGSFFAPVTVHAADGGHVIAGKAVNGSVTFYSDEACQNPITGAASGRRVYIKVIPDAGYYYSATTVTKVDGTPATDVTVERVGDEGNVYSFVMPGYDVLVTGVFQPPPEAKKEMEPNGDGTYNLSLSVKGTSADLSAAASTAKKVNVVVVMDRSTSMVRNTNNVETYLEYTGSTYPSTSGPYYGLVNGEYVVLNRNNNAWTYQVPVLREYTGTNRYVEDSGTTSNKWVVSNNSLIEVTYTRRQSNGYHWFQANSSSTTRYDNSIKYAVNNTVTNDVWGFVNGAMTSLTYSSEDGKYYHAVNTVAQSYNGTIYTLEEVSRLRAEQNALDQMLDSLLEYNNPDIQGLEDVVEIEVISFASGRGDGNNNRDINTLTTANAGIYAQYEGYGDTSSSTETGLLTSKTNLMAAVNNNGTSSGTNWEEAMQYAKDEADRIHALQPDEDVYILFLTDGEPTTHRGDYDAVGPTGYAQELQYALDDARNLVSASYIYPDNYADESLRGQDTNKKNYLYGVFTFGDKSGSGQNYLKQFVNYGYGYGTTTNLHTDDGEGHLAKYFFDAKDNASLISAMDTFIAAVFSSLAYGNVSITDGVTIGGTNSVTSSTLVSGTAGGFEYTVKGPNLGVLYTVTATGSDDNPTVTFHVNGTSYPGLKKSKTIHITGDNPNTPDVVEDEFDQTLTYWYFDETNYPNYKICLAAVDDAGLVHWDLSGIGALQNNWTYTTSFVVWPDQDAYDYAAGLNNNLGGDYIWNTETQQDSGKGYYTDGTKYPYLVRYPAAGAAASDITGSTYAVITNYEQSMSYNVLSEVTTNGVTQYMYGATANVEMDPPEPMGLEGSEFSVTKNWKDTLDPSHLLELINTAAEEGKTYGISLELYEDEELYKTYTFEPVYNDQTEEYEWPSQTISIAPALLVSELPEGTNADSFKSVTYNDKTYYVLNEGHEYTLKETETDFHFEFSTDTYHPALIDGVMANVSFVVDEHDRIVNGSTATQVGDVPLETFAGNNSLTAELDITKKIVDQINALTDAQEDAETFTYKVTLTVPYDPEDPDRYTQYMNAYEFVPRYNDSVTANNRYYIHGYQEDEDESLLGLPDDVSRFNGKVHGRYTVSYPGGYATLDEIFTPDSGGTTQTGVIYITLKQNEVLRISNLPKGTAYTIQEIYANLRQADPSRDADARPDVNTEESNIEEQGYTVSVETKNGTPEVSTTATANDTVSGTITDLNTRYYNQFTNTLSDAAAVNLAVTKHLENYEWSGERYYVRLSGSSPINRFTDKDRYLTRASGTEDVTYTYSSPLRFSEAGEYTFTFTEYDSEWTDVLSGTMSSDGIRYGEAVTVKVTVNVVDKKLVITKVEGGTFTDSDGDGVKDLIKATITNKTTPLSLYKIGESDPNTALSGVKFKLYSDADCEDIHLVKQDARGTAIGNDGELTTDENGTVRIGILSAGVYYLQETAAKDGYDLLSEIVTITVAADGTISYKQESYNPSKMYSSKSRSEVLVKENGGLFITDTDDEGNATGYTITINNTGGVELPMTGGSGTLLYTLSGIAMMLAAAFIWSCWGRFSGLI